MTRLLPYPSLTCTSVGRFVDAAFSRPPHICCVVAAVVDAMRPDLEQERPRRRKLQHLCVLAAIATNLEVPFVVDPEAVVRVGPCKPFPWSAPTASEVTRLIELQDRWGDGAA